MAKQYNGEVELLPGLNYTDEQMFFLAFGQVHVGTMCIYHILVKYWIFMVFVPSFFYLFNFRCMT